MGKGSDSKGDLIGYRVITQSLIVGSKVFGQGEIVTLADAGQELDLVYDLKLVEPVYGESSRASMSKRPKPRTFRSLIAFKKVL
jgi:hypothetical protein